MIDMKLEQFENLAKIVSESKPVKVNIGLSTFPLTIDSVNGEEDRAIVRVYLRFKDNTQTYVSRFLGKGWTKEWGHDDVPNASRPRYIEDLPA